MFRQVEEKGAQLHLSLGNIFCSFSWYWEISDWGWFGEQSSSHFSKRQCYKLSSAANWKGGIMDKCLERCTTENCSSSAPFPAQLCILTLWANNFNPSTPWMTNLWRSCSSLSAAFKYVIFKELWDSQAYLTLDGQIFSGPIHRLWSIQEKSNCWRASEAWPCWELLPCSLFFQFTSPNTQKVSHILTAVPVLLLSQNKTDLSERMAASGWPRQACGKGQSCYDFSQNVHSCPSCKWG